MMSPGRVLRRLLKNKLSLISVVLLSALVLLAFIGPLVAPYPEDGKGNVRLSQRLEEPTDGFPLGTDEMGRDILSRILLGVRISLTTGVVVVGIAATIGVTVGAVAGYVGGWLDEGLMRVTDAFLSIPSLVLALAVAASMGPGLTNALLAISFVWWPWYARLVRSQTISIRELDYVESARAAGATPLRIIFYHVLPNCIAPIFVQASLDMGYVILTAASLGFLGVGAQPPTPEWGLMVSSGRQFFPVRWWVSTFPGLAIFITVLAFNLFGDAIRDTLDPKLRR